MPRIRSLILVACGPRSADILSRYGSAIFWKPDLSTSLTILTPIDFSLVADSCSSAIALAGWFLLTSSAAVWTQLFCSGERLLHNLSLTQVKLLFASCSVIVRSACSQDRRSRHFPPHRPHLSVMTCKRC